MKLYSFYNLGNTCYLNSVLGCFITIPNFKKYLKKDNEVSEYLKKNIHVDLTDNHEFINHKHLPQKITKFFSKKFRLFQQHDAHEFLLDFLDTLDVKEFCGKTKMNITCSCCNNVSSTIEDFTTINLPCEKSNLTDLMIKYLEKEDIHDYHCEKCNEKTLAHKKIFLYNLPDFLVIVLKSYTSTGKIHTEVNFNEILKIRETLTEEIFEYSLYGIIYHHGNSERGHYNCAVKVNGRWFSVDDDVINLINSTNVINCINSYILFYKKNNI